MKTNGSDCSIFSKSNGTMTVDPEKDLLQGVSRQQGSF
jgi:hypothetical protein